MVWYGMVWCDMVEQGVVWCGNVWSHKQSGYLGFLYNVELYWTKVLN